MSLLELFDGKPIGRVDLNPKPQSNEPSLHNVRYGTDVCMNCGVTQADIMNNFVPGRCPGVKLVLKAKQDEYWKAIRATAEGTNITSAPVSEGNA